MINEIELHEIVEAAVLEGDTRLQALEAEGKSLPTYLKWTNIEREEATQWPSFSETVLASNVVNYEDCFAFKAGAYAGPIIIGELRTFTTLISYFTSDPNRADRIFPFEDSPNRDQIVALRAVGLATKIINRLRHSGEAATYENIEQLYRLLVKPLLGGPLFGELMVPLVMTPFESENTVELAEGIRLEAMDDHTQLARVQRDWASPVPYIVLESATHALVLDNFQLYEPNRLLRAYSEKQFPLDRIDQVLQAIRLVTNAPTGYAQILIRPIDWADGWRGPLPPLIRALTLRRYPAHFDNSGWLERRTPISWNQIKDIGDTISLLVQSTPKIQWAARRLSLAALRTDAEDRTIDACIGLESLLGDPEGDLTYKLALRTAAVCIDDSAGYTLNPTVVFSMVKQLYKHRSAIAHGDSKRAAKTARLSFPDGTSMRTDVVAIFLLREVLVRLIRHAEWGNPQLVDDLIVSRLGATAESG